MIRLILRAVVIVLLLVVPASASATAEPADPERALVVLASDADAGAVARALAAGGVRVEERFDAAGVWVVEASPAALARAALVPGLASVRPDEPLTPLLARSRELVGAEAVPKDARGMPLENGRNVTIAIVDSGVDAAHPGFAGRVEVAVRMLKSGGTTRASGDEDGHGTHVAGIAAGSGAASADARLRGVAPGARLAVLDISDSFTTTSAVRAFRWIHDNHDAHDIRVVTNSWGREKEENAYDPDDPVVRAANALVADGIVVVFSAGNRGEDGASTLTVEAVNPNVIAVGATDFQGRIESYSSRGPARDVDGAAVPWVKPDLVAPGSGIVSARTGARAPAHAESDEERHYVVMNGTSMAAPHVAAAAALLVSKDPTLTPGAVAALLTGTARDVGARGPDADTGHGMLDVAGALLALESSDLERRLVTVMKQVPLRADGTVTGGKGAVLLEGHSVNAPPKPAISFPLSLAQGAERVAFHVNWSSPAADFQVFLVSPSGARVGPFTAARPGSVAVAADVSAGSWRVDVAPVGLAVATPVTLEGYATVAETRVLESGGLGLPQPRGFLGSGDGFPDAPTVTALAHWFRVVPAARLGVGAALAVAGVLLLVRARRDP